MTFEHTLPIIDGHNDTLLRLFPPRGEAGRSFFVRSSQGHLDLPRAREGGFAGGFFAIFVPPDPATVEVLMAARQENPQDMPPMPPLAFDYAHATARAMMKGLASLERDSHGEARMVRSVDDLIACLRRGVLAMILHFEGAEAIDSRLKNLPGLYEAGLRSVGIVWSRVNAFGYGVPLKFPASPDTGPGLTDAGKGLVRVCNSLGIMLDLSHLNAQGFWDVAGLSLAPLVATHSCVHALCPSPRNLTDKQLDAIGESDGIVGVNYHVGFLRADGQSNPDTPLAEIVHHISYIAERIGIDHVGLGSDFDGATMPAELGDVTGLPKLVAALRDHGYDEAALRKVTHENWIRVLRKTW